jgi:serine/threonine kinase 32
MTASQGQGSQAEGSQGQGSIQAAAIGQPNNLPQAITTNEATAAPAPAPTNGNHQAGAATDPRTRSHSHGGPLRNQGTAQPQASQHMPPHFRGPKQSGAVPSATGGVSFTLDGTGSWSDLARRDKTLPADANALGAENGGGSGGMFGIFGRKRRGYSPKPKERGVLGKEGARQIIG